MPTKQLVPKLAAVQHPAVAGTAFSSSGPASLPIVAGIPVYPSNQSPDSIVGDVPISGTYSDVLAYARSRNFPTFGSIGATPDRAVVVVACCLVVQPFPVPLFSIVRISTGRSLLWTTLWLCRFYSTHPYQALRRCQFRAPRGPPSVLLAVNPYSKPTDALMFFLPPRGNPPNPYWVQVTSGRVPWMPTSGGLDLNQLATT